MVNTYSDNYWSALKCLKDTEANLCNVLVMASNFNIRDKNWDFSYSFYLIHSDFLFDIVGSLILKLSCPIQQVSTYYSDNTNNTNKSNHWLIFSLSKFYQVQQLCYYP